MRDARQRRTHLTLFAPPPPSAHLHTRARTRTWRDAPQVRDDSEWPRLSQVPNLLDPWNEVRDKFNVATDEFKVGVHRVIMRALSMWAQ